MPAVTPAPSPSLGVVVLYAAVPAVAALLGAGVAVLRPPGATLRAYLQHFAAGVVFALVGGELLAELKRLHAIPEIVGGFTAGVALMLVMRSLTRRLAGPPPTATSGLAAAESRAEYITASSAAAPAGRAAMAGLVGLLVAVGIDFVVDGALVGIGFAAGASAGRLLVLALTIEVLSLGLAVATEVLGAGRSRRETLGVIALLGGVLVVAAGLGFAVLRTLGPGWLASVVAFGAAALLYLVTEELLLEAHEVPETPVSTAMFFVGFLTLFLLELAA